jgi:hypothetical protein
MARCGTSGQVLICWSDPSSGIIFVIGPTLIVETTLMMRTTLIPTAKGNGRNDFKFEHRNKKKSPA